MMGATAWILIGASLCVIAFIAGVAVGETNADRQTAKHVEGWNLIEQLRASEGAEVCIFCDNSDFQGENSAIEICDDWTDWKHRRFEGVNLLQALRTARYTRGDY